MKNYFKKTVSLIVTIILFAVFSPGNQAKALEDDNNIYLKDLLTVDNGYTSNQIKVMANIPVNTSQIQLCFNNIDFNNVTLTPGIEGWSISDNVSYPNTCRMLTKGNTQDPIAAGTNGVHVMTITHIPETSFAYTLIDYNGGNNGSYIASTGVDISVDTTAYTVSANEHPTFKEIWLQVEDGTLGSQQRTFDGNNVFMLQLYDGQNTTEGKNVVRDNPYIYIKVSDSTDILTNVVKINGTNVTLGTKDQLLEQDKNGFYSHLTGLEYAIQYTDLALGLYDDQMTALTATSLNGLSFVTQLDQERPSSVTDAVMTQESESNSVITFTKSMDNSAVSKYYLVEKGALERAQVFDESNGINSSSLLGKIEQLKIKEVETSSIQGNIVTINFAKSNLKDSNSTDKTSISNNQFLVVAMDDAHTVAGDPAGNFSQVVDDSNWFYVQRKGDFDNDGKANLVDVVKFARYYMGATDSLY